MQNLPTVGSYTLSPLHLLCALAWGVYAPMASHVSSWYLNHGSAESTHCRKLHTLPPASLMCSCMGCLRTNGKPCLLLVLEPRQCRIYPLSEATRSSPLPILCALAWGVYAPMASHVSSWYLNHGSAESTHLGSYTLSPLPILCALAWGVYAPMASHVSSWYLNHGSAESTHCRKTSVSRQI